MTPVNGVFITGTDTGVGKTVVGCAIARALTSRGTPVAVRKPVESGCDADDDGHLRPADGMALAAAAGGREPLDDVTPIRLRHALSPARAATLEGRALRLAELATVVRAGAPDDYRLVEGAGGFLSPLAADGLNADLAVMLDLPVLLIVADRLGCINHALLTVEAIESRGLHLAQVVVNAITVDAGDRMDNLEDLRARLRVPVVGFGFGGDKATADGIAGRLPRR